MARIIAVDIETRPDGTPFCVGFCNEQMKFTYFRWKTRPQDRCIHMLEDPNTAKVFHNASYDIGRLKQIGVNVQGEIHDTFILAHLLLDDEPSKGLKQLAEKHLNSDRSDAEAIKYWVKKSRLGYDSYDHAKLKAYNKKDVTDTMRLFYKLKEAIEWPIYPLEQKLIPVIIHMEEAGIRIDMKKCSQFQAEYKTKLDKLCYIFKTKYSLENPNSAAQLSELIYKRLKLPRVDYKPKHKPQEAEDAQPSTDGLALIMIQQKNDHPVLKMIQEYRTLSTVEHFFLNPFMNKNINGFIYPRFNQLGQVTERGVRTGRFSSSGPNFQNIKRGPEVRQLIIPRKGHYLLSADYKQIEMVLYAYLAHDKTLIDVYKNGGDIHNFHKAEFVDPYRPDVDGLNRMIAKHMGFELIYGIGAPGMQRFLAGRGIFLAEHLVSRMIERWHYHHPALAKFKKELYHIYKSNGGEYITDFYGRYYHLPYNRFYIAVNYFIQGMAANIIKDVMPDVCEFMTAIGGKLIMTIHDELVCDIPYSAGKPVEVAEHVSKLMRKPGIRLSVPLRVDYAICKHDWGEAK